MADSTQEMLRDAIGDILDIVEGWTRPMADADKLAAIHGVASKAWEARDE